MASRGWRTNRVWDVWVASCDNVGTGCVRACRSWAKCFKKNLIMLAKAFICYVTERAILASRALSLCVLNVACKFEAKHVISRQRILSKTPTDKSWGDRVENVRLRRCEGLSICRSYETCTITRYSSWRQRHRSYIAKAKQPFFYVGQLERTCFVLAWTCPAWHSYRWCTKASRCDFKIKMSEIGSARLAQARHTSVTLNVASSVLEMD